METSNLELHKKTNVHCSIHPRVDSCKFNSLHYHNLQKVLVSCLWEFLDQVKRTSMDMFITDILHMDVQCRTAYPYYLSFHILIRKFLKTPGTSYTLLNTSVKSNEGRNQSCLCFISNDNTTYFELHTGMNMHCPFFQQLMTTFNNLNCTCIYAITCMFMQAETP